MARLLGFYGRTAGLILWAFVCWGCSAAQSPSVKSASLDGSSTEAHTSSAAQHDGVETAAASGPGSVFGGLQVEDYPTQRLFRVQAKGPRGSGSLKVIARVESPERYRLSASDLFGRLLWEFESAREQVRLLDHRQKVVCDLAEGELSLEGLGLDAIQGRSVVRLLLGRLPVEIAVPSADWPPEASARLEAEDPQGRRWSVVWESAELQSWTLWSQDTPAVWWQKDGPRSAILSTRGGAQLRWRETASEPAAAWTEDLQVPAAFSKGECGDLGIS